MTLNLTMPRSDVSPKSVELVFEVGEALEKAGIEPTREQVTLLIQLAINNPESLEIDSKSLARLIVSTFIFGLERNKVSLETKEDFLRELEELKEGGGNISKSRIDEFREKLFGNIEVLQIQDHYIGNNMNEVWNYFGDGKKWVNGMSENIHDALKEYIKDKFRES